MTHERVALVTGGTRGIGAAITRRLACDGCHVVAVYRANQAAAEELCERLTAAGASVTTVQGDIGHPRDAGRVVATTLERWGRIDYLVNNAGVLRDARLRTMPLDDWDEVIRVDLSGVFYVTQPTVRAMVAQAFGRIVTISSVAGSMGSVWQANYAAAKAGLLGLTRSIARDGARRGITANLIIAGPIESDLSASVPEDRVRDIVARIPMQRLGTPDEVAHAVRFLIDDRSSYVTGSVVTVDGGMSMG